MAKNKSLKGFLKNFDPQKVKEIIANRHAIISRPKGGVIIPKTCNCGNYTPKSTKGIIDTSCRNCGGQKKVIRLN